jgi:hypothetical protein
MTLGFACISMAIKASSWEIGPTPIGAESKTGIVGDKSRGVEGLRIQKSAGIVGIENVYS